MKRTDILIAKLRAKQKIREVVMVHQANFAPPAPPPQQEQQNAGTQPLPTEATPPAPDQSNGYSPDNGLAEQP
jgi:hypothetical protein